MTAVDSVDGGGGIENGDLSIEFRFRRTGYCRGDDGVGESADRANDEESLDEARAHLVLKFTGNFTGFHNNM